jgi:hypothetical protein
MDGYYKMIGHISLTILFGGIKNVAIQPQGSVVVVVGNCNIVVGMIAVLVIVPYGWSHCGTTTFFSCFSYWYYHHINYIIYGPTWIVRRKKIMGIITLV